MTILHPYSPPILKRTKFWRCCRGVGVFQYRGLFELSRLSFFEKIQKKLKTKKINMAIFHFPQFEHEPFWQYLSRLNDYRAQYVHSMYEK